MPDLKLEIKNCRHCPWKTEYYGDPEDYWMCDQAPGRRIPAKYLKEETVGEPWFCPWRKKPVTRKWLEEATGKSVWAGLTCYKQAWVYWLAAKYWIQGDPWDEAKTFALAIVVGWKR